MSEPAERTHPTVDMTKVGRIIRKMHDQVCGKRQRYQITRAGCEDVCVMISCQELAEIENALAVLADSDSYKDICSELKDLVRSAGMLHGPIPDPADGAHAYS